jgi:hypothetical protein
MRLFRDELLASATASERKEDGERPRVGLKPATLIEMLDANLTLWHAAQP